MDIMGEWLSTTIQKDLGQVVDHTSGQSKNSSKASYEDDGSNLRVKASKKGVVQITKVRHPSPSRSKCIKCNAY